MVSKQAQKIAELEQQLKVETLALLLALCLFRRRRRR
jgi:hypothetical protein